MNANTLKPILEAVLMAADTPLPMDRLVGLFASLGDGAPSRTEIEAVLTELARDCESRGVELAHVAGGYRFQTRAEYADWINRLWEERKPRYSRALLETLAIIAYRQPITRGEIEDIRGVAVSSGIIKTLQDREWIKVVGHRDVPGRPAIYATTRQFLEYFSLPSLDALPTLAELRDFDDVNADLFAETGVENPRDPDEERGDDEPLDESSPASEEAGTRKEHSEPSTAAAESPPASASAGDPAGLTDVEDPDARPAD